MHFPFIWRELDSKEKWSARKRGKRDAGVYIVQFDHFPPPPLLRSFFSPTNKFAAGGAKPRLTAGEGRKTPPRNFFGVYDPKRCIFKAFSPVFYVIFDE